MALYELRKWYIERQIQEEQERYEQYPSKYNFYDNGERVTKEERIMFRNRLDIINFFKDTNPYIVNQDRSYYFWYRDENNHFKTPEKLLNEAEARLQKVNEKLESVSEELTKVRQENSLLQENLSLKEKRLKAITDSKLGWIVDKFVK